jgi:hypothetical protein
MTPYVQSYRATVPYDVSTVSVVRHVTSRYVTLLTEAETMKLKLSK